MHSSAFHYFPPNFVTELFTMSGWSWARGLACAFPAVPSIFLWTDSHDSSHLLSKFLLFSFPSPHLFRCLKHLKQLKVFYSFLSACALHLQTSKASLILKNKVVLDLRQLSAIDSSLVVRHRTVWSLSSSPIECNFQIVQQHAVLATLYQNFLTFTQSQIQRVWEFCSWFSIFDDLEVVMLWRLRRHKVGNRKSVGGRGMGFEKTGKVNLIRNEKYSPCICRCLNFVV